MRLGQRQHLAFMQISILSFGRKLDISFQYLNGNVSAGSMGFQFSSFMKAN